MHERPVAFQPVGQMPDPERVGRRLIVVEDRAEIVEHQESRAVGAGRSEQARLVAGTRKGSPPTRAIPSLLPIARRFRVFSLIFLGLKPLGSVTS